MEKADFQGHSNVFLPAKVLETAKSDSLMGHMAPDTTFPTATILALD